jgi:hypothetical protein
MFLCKFVLEELSETVSLYLAPAQAAPRRQHLLLVVFRVPESDTGLLFISSVIENRQPSTS